MTTNVTPSAPEPSPPVRLCELDACRVPLVQRAGERNDSFKRRRFCNSRCSAIRQTGEDPTVYRPVPGYEIPDWHADAPCREIGGEVFDPAFQDLFHQAVEACGRCPFSAGGIESPCVRDGFLVGDAVMVRGGKSMATWRREDRRQRAMVRDAGRAS